jgi:hypothetical protein
MPAPLDDIRPDVLKLLETFKGPDPMKELFWRHLNYDRVNKPLSRRNWAAPPAEALAEDPTLLAAGGDGGDFKVLYARLAKDRLSLADERIVTSRLLRDYPHALFVFSDRSQVDWHLLNVRLLESPGQRRQYRRLSIGRGERVRTAVEVVSKLDLSVIKEGKRSVSPLLIQQRHDLAFDVEPVQAAFFRTFVEVYHRVADDISSESGMENKAGELSQLLLDRLLFLYFIQKKGWLNKEPDYLYSRFRKHWNKNPQGDDFYIDVLLPLFHRLSGAKAAVSSSELIPFLNGGLFDDRKSQSERIAEVRLNIPNATFKVIFDDLLERFNFTVTEDTPFDVEVAIDPEMLGKIFESLVLQLEKEPDKDLRKLTGSYYTPRPIVHFMCRQALRAYLLRQVMGTTTDGMQHQHTIDSLLSFPAPELLDEKEMADFHSLLSVDQARSLKQMILTCRICDPSVGSGAFLVGMLHDITTVVSKLDWLLHGKEYLQQANYEYNIKKQIIENCLYGVDLQEQAVRLCELRLWLSLVVDYQIDDSHPFASAIRDVPSLPNLSYRVLKGDSLVEHLFGQEIQLERMATDASTRSLIESIQADKQAYFRESDSAEKRRLELKVIGKHVELAERLVIVKQESLVAHNLGLFGETLHDRQLRELRESQESNLTELRAQIKKARMEVEALSRRVHGQSKPSESDRTRSYIFQSGGIASFIWRVDFAEAFCGSDGFDIVIGNPPYLSGKNTLQQLGRDYKTTLERLYRTAQGIYDLYVPFWELALRLIKPTGVATLIVPNKILVADYATSLRKELATHSVSLIADVSDLGPFKEAAVYPIIILAQKAINGVRQSRIVDSISSLEQIGDCPPRIVEQEQLFPSSGKVWRLQTQDDHGSGRTVVRRLCEVAVVHGGITGFSAQKALGAMTNGRRSKSSIPFVVTGNIDPYIVEHGRTRYMKHAFDDPYLEPDFDCVSKEKWKLFNTPRIIIAGMTKVIEAAYVDAPMAVGVAVYSVTDCSVDPYYLLAVLNSEYVSKWYMNEFRAKHLAGGFLSINKSQLEMIPVSIADKAKQREISGEVQQLIRALGSGKKQEAFAIRNRVEASVEVLFAGTR